MRTLIGISLILGILLLSLGMYLKVTLNKLNTAEADLKTAQADLLILEDQKERAEKAQTRLTKELNQLHLRTRKKQQELSALPVTPDEQVVSEVLLRSLDD